MMSTTQLIRGTHSAVRLHIVCDPNILGKLPVAQDSVTHNATLAWAFHYFRQYKDIASTDVSMDDSA